MNRSLWIGGLMTLITVIVFAFGPHLPLIDESLERTLVIRDEAGKLLVPPIEPSKDFLLGTDKHGRDLLSRLIIGARETLILVAIIAGLRLTFGLVLSILSFYFKPAKVVMDLWNRLFSFMPSIFFIIVFLNIPFIMFSPNRDVWAILTIALAEGGRVASVFYAMMTEIQKKTFMEAAIAAGGSRWNLFRRHYWPIMKGHVLVQSLTEAARTMFLIAQLAFLQIFINQVFMSQEARGTYLSIDQSHSWMSFFHEARLDVYVAPWIPVSGFLAITFVMVGLYLLADGLQRRYLMKQRRMV